VSTLPGVAAPSSRHGMHLKPQYGMQLSQLAAKEVSTRVRSSQPVNCFTSLGFGGGEGRSVKGGGERALSLSECC
jgi:hypothetical protein